MDKKPPFRFKGDRGYLDTTKLANGRHRLTVVSLNGRTATRSTIRVVVANAPKAGRPRKPPVPPPTAAGAMTAAAIDHGHVRLSWPAASGATAYLVYRDGKLVASTSATSLTDAMLWPKTSYRYRVEARSAASTLISSFAASVSTTALPASGYPRPFAASSVWNTPVSGAARAVSNSGTLIDHFEANLRWPNMPLHNWAASVAEASPASSVFDIACSLYNPCTLSAFGSVPVPLTAAPDPSADGHMAVYDPVSKRAWGMWQAKKQGGSWRASAGEAVSTTGSGLVPEGTASSNAANFPLVAGLVRPEEILQGRIDHALVFTMPSVSKAGHVCPASHNDGSSSSPNALREGSRLQLDPSLDVDALPIPAWKKTIARALQIYGMYLRDEGGSVAIMAENPISRGYDAWGKVGLSGDSVSLADIPWDRFRVVSAPC